MKKYLYLTHRSWVDAWINGGVIPIALASKYIGAKRMGTMTPDENRVHKGAISFQELRDLGINIDGVRELNIVNSNLRGHYISEFKGAFYKEDGLILSFCNSLDRHIASELGKKACVRIEDIDWLKEIIDEQLEVSGLAGSCLYTSGHERDHFLKSIEDAWQDEFRIFWSITEEKNITLPPGMATEVSLEKLANQQDDFNPLARTFSDKVMLLSDLHLPRQQIHFRKTFVRCKIVGPGKVHFQGGTVTNTAFLEAGNAIVIPDDFPMNDVVVLTDCEIDESVFFGVTVLVRKRDVDAFVKMGASIVNAD